MWPVLNIGVQCSCVRDACESRVTCFFYFILTDLFFLSKKKKQNKTGGLSVGGVPSSSEQQRFTYGMRLGPGGAALTGPVSAVSVEASQCRSGGVVMI